MKRLLLLVSSILLLALSQLVYAGGPEMPDNYGGFYIGLGGAVEFVQVEEEALSPFQTNVPGLPPTGLITGATEFGLSPVGQIGYDWYFASGAFIGLKGLYDYIDKNSNGFIGITQFNFRSMAAGMLVAGFRHGNNAFYAEAGYAALFSEQKIFNAVGLFLEGSATNTLSGGIAGVGYRRYFWQHLFVDVVYSYALFQDPGRFLVNDSARPGTNILQLAKRPRVQDITFTVNYMF